MTVIRTMLRIYPDLDRVGISENRFAHTLADAVTGSFQNNLEFLHQATESIVLSVAVQ